MRRRLAAALSPPSSPRAAAAARSRRSSSPRRSGAGPQTATIIRPDVDGQAPGRALPPRLGREPAALLPAVARAPRARGQRRDLPALPGLGRRAAAAGARQRARRRPPRRSQRVDEEPGSLVVAGHSAGGALAADYAGIARSVGLPVPIAVFSAYPGRTLPRLPFGDPGDRPGADPGGHARGRARGHARPRGRHAAGAAARAPGGRAAASLVVIRDPAVSDHLGPQRADPAARREFWARLDRLIERLVAEPLPHVQEPGRADLAGLDRRRSTSGSMPSSPSRYGVHSSDRSANRGASAASIASDECSPAWSARQSALRPPCSRYQRWVGSSTTSQACSWSRSRPPGASSAAIFSTAAREVVDVVQRAVRDDRVERARVGEVLEGHALEQLALRRPAGRSRARRGRGGPSRSASAPWPQPTSSTRAGGRAGGRRRTVRGSSRRLYRPFSEHSRSHDRRQTPWT